MNHEFWVLRSPVVEKLDGGYIGISTDIRETVRLERRAQRILQKLSVSQAPEVIPSRIEKNPTENYFLDVIPRKCISRQHSVTYLPWSYTKELTKFTDEAPKEKIKIDNESKKLFIRLISLSDPEMKYSAIPKRRDGSKRLESFKVNIQFLKHPKQLIWKKYSGKYMPSVLEARSQKVLEESISGTVVIASQGKFVLQYNHLSSDSHRRYLLDVFSGHGNPLERLSRLDKFHQWHSSATGNSEVVFELLRAQLFDLQFNRLEFFKLPVQTERSHSMRFKRVSLKTWKLLKVGLKQLNWNPFKNWEKINVNDLLSEEVVEQKMHFQPFQYELNFHILSYSSLDFINLEQSSFGSLNFVSASRPEPAAREPYGSPDIAKAETTTSLEDHTTEVSQSVNDSMIPQKRSFIDDDLLTVLQSKRKSRRNDTSADQSSLGVNLLRIVNKEINFLDELEAKATVEDISSPEVPTIPFKPPKESREVLINSTRILHNHKIIQYLSNETDLRLVEQELPYQCDFVIDATSCVLRIQLDKFFQLQNDGTLFYENTLKALLLECKTVVLLVEYPHILDQADRDLFWKIRLFLQAPHFQLYITQGTPHDIGIWICMLTREVSGTLEHREASTLLALRFNKFLVHELLTQYSLADILIKVATNQGRELLTLLTDHQLRRIRKLMALGW